MTTQQIEVEVDRPFWLTGPCQPWCVRDHQACVIDQDRHHADMGAPVQLTHHPGWGSLFEPQPVHVGLFQGPRETEAYVEVFYPPRDAAIRLTLSEAAARASYISAAVASARTAITAKEHAA